MLALLDARMGRKITGIGIYTVHLAEALARIAPSEVVPIVNKAQSRRFSEMGLQAWTVPSRSDESAFPPADLIHGPNFHAPAHPNAQRVATVHDLGYLHLPECHPPGMPERLDRLIRDAIPHTAVWLCDSESVRQDFIEVYGVPEERCRLVYLGVSDEFVRAGERPALPMPRRWRVQAPYLLHVGAMVPRKDLRTLVEAFSIFRRSHPEFQLVLAGNKTRRWASDWPKVKEWMKANRSDAQHVRVLNYVPHQHKLSLYRHAAACVSATRWEGFGLTVLEGLGVGRPVVTSRISSLPEVGGEVVYYGTPRNPESYAAAFAEAVQQDERGDRAHAGRRLASQFTWQRTAEATMAAYREAAGPLALS